MSNSWKIYLLALVSFLIGTSEYVLSGILDRVAGALDVSLAAAGQLITIFSLVYGLFTPILMAMTARMDRKKLILYSVGLFVISNIFAFVLPGYGWFMGARILMAVGAGTVVVTALNIAAKIAPEGRQASSIATVVMGFTASLIISVPLGRVIANVYGWKTVFAAVAMLGIVAIVILALTLPEVKGDAPIPLRKQLSLLKKPKVALGLSVTFFWVGGYSIAYTYLSPFLLQVSGLPERYLSGTLLVFGIASLIGSKLGGYSTDRWGVYRTLLGGMAIHILMLVLLSLVTDSPAGVIAILLVWSFSAWSTGPTQQYHLTTIEPEATGVMLGLNQSMMQLSMAAGAGLGGAAIETVSLSFTPWLGAAGVAVAIVAALLICRLNGKQKSARYHAATASNDH
ncbi:MFS transporter [Paenibacillus aurantiacus]|uniref:MFS transporter n=1 Tax=Paenibacillus aurantiacus TaxID=1936118 RepID=A0ABV5KPD1_9BACL